ncbi:MAG: aminotransferase class V-fold PLP-dependent enzyme, partial [Alphaproteobacteria bacterium]
MLTTVQGLLDEVRGKFSQVDTCPVQGPRIFFENAGGSLTLNSVVKTTTHYAAIPDNQGRANPASEQAGQMISQAKDDIRTFFN